MTAKSELRERVRDMRQRLSPQDIAALGAKVQANAIRSDQFLSAKTAALYLPLPGEVPTGDIVGAARSMGKRVAVPSSRIAPGEYRFAWLDADAETSAGRYGIAEPVDACAAAPSDIDLVVLPGLAFDQHGGRIGQGAGIYDRLLRRYRGTTLALAFSFQLFQDLPQHEHDHAVDYLATESGFYSCGAANPEIARTSNELSEIASEI